MHEFKAIWENGYLRPLEKIDFVDGEEVIVNIVSAPQTNWGWLKIAMPWLRFPEPHVNPDFNLDELQAEIDKAIEQPLNIAETIIEDREDRF
jgi:hypothetical protein